MGINENPIIRLSNTGIKCFTTDTIYDSTHNRYTDTYNTAIKDCNIVDMECYALAYVCKQREIAFYSFKWISDDGVPNDWHENAKIGFENFKNIFVDFFVGEY
jgi:nucleoside phosphorylase